MANYRHRQVIAHQADGDVDGMWELVDVRRMFKSLTSVMLLFPFCSSFFFVYRTDDFIQELAALEAGIPSPVTSEDDEQWTLVPPKKKRTGFQLVQTTTADIYCPSGQGAPAADAAAARKSM